MTLDTETKDPVATGRKMHYAFSCSKNLRMTDMSSRHESIKQMHAIQLHPAFTMAMIPQTMHRIIQHISNKDINFSIIKNISKLIGVSAYIFAAPAPCGKPIGRKLPFLTK